MRITVVGDTLLDIDLVGSADRLSPDAPVPVVGVSQIRRRPGGAGLVAALLARDGIDVELVTALSADAGGEVLRECLAEFGRVYGGSLRVSASVLDAPTPTKTRVRSPDHAFVRIDEGCDDAGVPEVTDELVERVGSAECIVVADYGRRLVEHPRLRHALERAAARVPVLWDPHPKGPDPVPQCAVVTPNLREATELARTPGSGLESAARAGALLRERWSAQSVLVTMGERGALLVGRDEPPHAIPVREVPGADTCGAGDRLVAGLARRVLAGDPARSAAEGAVAEVARFLVGGGVASLLAPSNTSVLGGEGHDALSVVARVRASGGTVVATGGCFDLIHAGHARTLAAARSLGDCLIVCLNSDDSVRRLKGRERPIMNEDDRRELLLALECVDAVMVFGEDTPEDVIRRIEPDIWVKGGDYVAEQLPESAALAEWGGRTVTVPYIPGRSTTSLARALSLVG